MYGQIRGSMCLMQRKAKRSKSGLSRIQSSTMPDNYVVSSSLNQMMNNLKHTMENARRKLEIPMPAEMPCKTPTNCRGETCRNIGKRKTRYACIVDASESMRIRFKGVPHRYHEDHISAKGIFSPSRYNLVHKFIPMPQALKFQKRRLQWEKNGKNLRRYRGQGNLERSTKIRLGKSSKLGMFVR